MKKTILTLSLLLIAFLLLAWYALEAEQTNPHTWYRVQSNDHSLANAQQVEGIYIFILCKPVAEYEYQGTLKSGMTMSGKPDELVNNIVKQCKKKFPSADGIIFSDATLEKADCIKFK